MQKPTINYSIMTKNNSCAGPAPSSPCLWPTSSRMGSSSTMVKVLFFSYSSSSMIFTFSSFLRAQGSEVGTGAAHSAVRSLFISVSLSLGTAGQHCVKQNQKIDSGVDSGPFWIKRASPRATSLHSESQNTELGKRGAEFFFFYFFFVFFLNWNMLDVAQHPACIFKSKTTGVSMFPVTREGAESFHCR